MSITRVKPVMRLPSCSALSVGLARVDALRDQVGMTARRVDDLAHFFEILLDQVGNRRPVRRLDGDHHVGVVLRVQRRNPAGDALAGAVDVKAHRLPGCRRRCARAVSTILVGSVRRVLNSTAAATQPSARISFRSVPRMRAGGGIFLNQTVRAVENQYPLTQTVQDDLVFQSFV